MLVVICKFSKNSKNVIYAGRHICWLPPVTRNLDRKRNGAMPYISFVDYNIAIIFFNRYKSRYCGGFFCPHLTDLLWTPYKSQFWSRAPDFKRTYLRPQEELENVLTIQIEPEFSALSVYEVSRAIPGLLPYQNDDFRGVTKKPPPYAQ